MPAKKAAPKKVVEKKEAPKKEEPKKEAPKKEAPKKEAPKKEAPKKAEKKISAQEMEALRKKERKFRKKVRGVMNLKEQRAWGKRLDKDEEAKIAKEAEFRKELAEIRAKIAGVSL